MKFHCALSIWDYEEALRLHRHQKSGRQVCFLLLYRIVPVLCVVGLVLLGAFDVRTHTLSGWITFSFAIALLWVGIVMALVPRENLRRAFKRNAFAGQISITVDDSCVLIEVPEISETKVFWSGFIDMARSNKVTLLYISKDCFHILPTSAMTAEQQMELSTTIERNLVRK